MPSLTESNVNVRNLTSRKAGIKYKNLIINCKGKNVRPLLERKLWVIQHSETVVSSECQ